MVQSGLALTCTVTELLQVQIDEPYCFLTATLMVTGASLKESQMIWLVFWPAVITAWVTVQA
jgi:hypothetical protein